MTEKQLPGRFLFHGRTLRVFRAPKQRGVLQRSWAPGMCWPRDICCGRRNPTGSQFTLAPIENGPLAFLQHVYNVYQPPYHSTSLFSPPPEPLPVPEEVLYDLPGVRTVAGNISKGCQSHQRFLFGDLERNAHLFVAISGVALSAINSRILAYCSVQEYRCDESAAGVKRDKNTIPELCPEGDFLSRIRAPWIDILIISVWYMLQ